MNIITEKMTFGGNSIGKIDGKTVFIPYAIPGEELEISIKESKRDYDVAQIEKIIKPSSHRVEPKCKYYGQCGGCNMMHIDYEYQKELRIQMMEDIFEQNGIDIQGKVETVCGPDFGYRARFQFTNGGLCEKNSNNIVHIKRCECAENVINDWMSGSLEENRGRLHLFGSEFVCSAGGKESKLSITTPKDEVKVNKSIQVKGKSKKIKVKENHYFAGTVSSPENMITVELGGKKLSFDVRGFFQSNLFVFEKVVKLICNTLSNGQNILDMYSGCGSISTFLADKFENVVLVEHNRDALVYAEQNMQGTKHVSYGLSGANWVKNCAQFCGKFDACVVDPPRSGIEKEVCEYLCKSNIPQIRSLSCDPATHARDLSKLTKAGYTIQQIYLLDFYPHTSHIESLAILTKD